MSLAKFKPSERIKEKSTGKHAIVQSVTDVEYRVKPVDSSEDIFIPRNLAERQYVSVNVAHKQAMRDFVFK